MARPILHSLEVRIVTAPSSCCGTDKTYDGAAHGTRRQLTDSARVRLALSPLTIEELQDTVLQLRELPLRPEARAMVGRLAEQLAVGRHTSLGSARRADRRRASLLRQSRRLKPFVCEYCGETWPALQSRGKPRQACGDPRCSGRVGGSRPKAQAT